MGHQKLVNGLLVACVLLASGAAHAALGDYPIQMLPFETVKFTDGFWAQKEKTIREVTIPHNIKMCDWRIDKFAIVAGQKKGKYSGLWFDDTDVYKVIEGSSNSLKTHPDVQLEKVLDDIITLIAAAQQPDGYLYTPRFLAENEGHMEYFGKERWGNLIYSHELYCSGHLIEAGIAHFQATGKRSLLDVAIKNANLLCDTFGPDKKCDPPGHEEVELALIKLYRLTGDERYVKLAEFFLEQRGKTNPCRGNLYGPNMQDHQPVIEQTEAVGHAVRAMYLYCGMSDVAALLGRPDYINALDKLWLDVVYRKMYLIGGIGAKKEGESFDEAYILPNETAYTETCAAIGMVFWNQRMFQRHGDAKYIDVLERSLYNGVLSGIAISGDKFFYNNVLAASKTADANIPQREPWMGCPCCPPNIVRLITSLGSYVFAQRPTDVYVNLFASCQTEITVAGESVSLSQQTRYPWDGHITIAVSPKKPVRFALRVRIPGWAREECVPGDLYSFATTSSGKPTLQLNNVAQPLELDKGYVCLDRQWQPDDKVVLELPMLPRRVLSNPQVQADARKVALQRGPLVYCLEAVDNVMPVNNVALPDTAALNAEFQPDLLGGVELVTGTVLKKEMLDPNAPPRVLPVHFRAIPYYAWANREPADMAVWLYRLMTPPPPPPLPPVPGKQ